MKLIQLFGILFTVCFLASCSTPSDSGSQKVRSEAEIIPFVGTMKAHRYRYSNGLKLIVVEDHSSPTFAYQTWFNVGSINEKPKYTGLAHLFEHMMFKATKNYPEGQFDKILEEAGAEGENAFTSNDYTAYVQELPKEHLELIAKLESDRMVNLVVDEKAFKTETEVVQNERRFRTENSPEGLMYQKLFEMVFTNHPYHWPVIGYQEDLARMKADDALAFYKKFYAPNLATIVVSGDVDADDVADLVAKYYGHLPRSQDFSNPVTYDADQNRSKSDRMKLNVQVEKLLMAYRVPSANSEESAVFEAIQGILTDGKSSRLNKKLIDMGIANGVSSGSYQQKDPTIFIFDVDLQKGKSAGTAKAVIEQSLRELASKPIPMTELQKTKNVLNFNFLQGLTSNSAKARFIGRSETVLGDLSKGIDLAYRKVQEVTPEQIQETAKKYFKPQNLTMITGVPK